MESKVVKLCDFCENRDGKDCESCKNNSQKAGRELVIEQMLKEKGFKSSAKLRNIVRASEIVLFKDLCRVFKVLPSSIPNKVTTNSIGEQALRDHLEKDEFVEKLKTFLTFEEIEKLMPAIENLDYVYDCANMVYGSSIHASGTLFSEEEMELPVDKETGDCHCDGHYAEELGYIKYDLLSLSALVPIENIQGMNIDWNDTVEDRELLEGLQKEDLSFTFQFGSPIVDNMIKGVNKKEIDAISLSEVTSINRPGPLSIDLNKTWVDTRNGVFENKEEIDFVIDDLRKSGILKI